MLLSWLSYESRLEPTLLKYSVFGPGMASLYPKFVAFVRSSFTYYRILGTFPESFRSNSQLTSCTKKLDTHYDGFEIKASTIERVQPTSLLGPITLANATSEQ